MHGAMVFCILSLAVLVSILGIVAVSQECRLDVLEERVPENPPHQEAPCPACGQPLPEAARPEGQEQGP